MTPAERAAAIAARARAAQPTREQNRDDDPQMAREMDGFRKWLDAEPWRVRWPEGREWVDKRRHKWPELA